VRAAILCALAFLLTVAPARADFDAATAARRARKEQLGGSALLFIGLANATVSLGSAAVLAFVPSCSDHNYLGAGGIGWCVNPTTVASVALASGLVTLPTLAVGITLRRAGDDDAFAAGQSLPNEFFVARARRRRRIGVPLTIAGVALTAAGIGFAGGAWDANANYQHRDRFPAMVSLASITGVVGVALLSDGATPSTLAADRR
jgi:hypothetical protein